MSSWHQFFNSLDLFHLSVIAALNRFTKQNFWSPKYISQTVTIASIRLLGIITKTGKKGCRGKVYYEVEGSKSPNLIAMASI